MKVTPELQALWKHGLRFSGKLTCGLKGSPETFEVDSLRDASDKFLVISDRFASSELPDAIVYCNGTPCARISYNGRVWEIGGRFDGQEVQVNASRPKACDTDWSKFRVPTLQ